jgi:hypothetical protein
MMSHAPMTTFTTRSLGTPSETSAMKVVTTPESQLTVNCARSCGQRNVDTSSQNPSATLK